MPWEFPRLCRDGSTGGLSLSETQRNEKLCPVYLAEEGWAFLIGIAGMTRGDDECDSGRYIGAVTGPPPSGETR